MNTRLSFRIARQWRAGALALIAALCLGPAAAIADDDAESLAFGLVERFYDALAPDNTELAAFLGEGFQIIGSDGLRFDRSSYLSFPKAITAFEISELIAKRDRDILTATFEIGYKGAVGGVDRIVPRLARIAVFQKTGDGWKLQALAALGTGENDVSATAAEVLGRWRAAAMSGDAEKIRPLVSPDFQLQLADGTGLSLDAFLADPSGLYQAAVAQDIVATSFSNTMVIRYNLKGSGDSLVPGLTVFQRINGEWRTAADAMYAATE